MPEKAPVEVLFQEKVTTGHDQRIQLINDILGFFEKQKARFKIDSYELHLILDEAITNSMEHGNRWEEDKFVDVRILREEPGSYSVKVKDDGIGFNPKILPDNLSVNGKLNPRGRGIFIIKKFCRTKWNVIGNEITLTLDEDKES